MESLKIGDTVWIKTEANNDWEKRQVNSTTMAMYHDEGFMKTGMVKIIRRDPETIVYLYNWKDLITIVRNAGGEWEYRYTINRVREYINKARRKNNEPIYLLSNAKDMFDLGKLVGYKVKELLDYCEESYGEEPKKEGVIVDDLKPRDMTPEEVEKFKNPWYSEMIKPRDNRPNFKVIDDI